MPLFLSSGAKLKKGDLIDVMKLYPLSELGIVSKEECSSHIYVHQSVFEKLMEDIPPHSVCYVKLTNNAPQHVYCNVYASHNSAKNAIYAPQWILVAMNNDHNTVTLELVKPNNCSGLVLQPHTQISLEKLKAGVENYSCMRAGATYKIWNPGGLKNDYTLVSVLETMPHSFDYLCILNCDIDLELHKPLDCAESYTPTIINPRKVDPPPDWTAMVGKSLGGTSSSKSIQELRLEAALRRVDKK